MTTAFNSLTKALEGWFSKPLAELPDPLRTRVVADFIGIDWDCLDDKRRRNVAEQWDYQNDPATEKERTQANQDWKDACKLGRINEDILKLELMSPPTPFEMESKNRLLDGLQKQREEIERKNEQSARSPRVTEIPDPLPIVSGAAECAVFRAMQNLTANEMSIAFVGDKGESGLGANNMLEISARKETKRVALAALDLVDRRRGTLNSQCAVLLGMAHKEKLTNSGKNAAKMKRLRQVFRTHMGIVEDPFDPYRRGTGWESRFKIYDKRGAADERAKREAERRTSSYEQFIEHGEKADNTNQIHSDFESEDDAAGEFLKGHDPEAPA